MPSSFRSGDCTADFDERGILFDERGAPLDRDWHCSPAKLAAVADVLRQSWPEETLAELFAEAHRRWPDQVPPTPPPPVPPPAVERPPRSRRRSRRAPPSPTPPSPLRGFSDEALQALRVRATLAARELDPTFPIALGLHLQASFDPDHAKGRELRTYRAAAEGRAFVLEVESELQDGVGGPVARPLHATFRIEGLPIGLGLRGEWDGTEAVATIEGPDAAVRRARAVLSGA